MREHGMMLCDRETGRPVDTGDRLVNNKGELVTLLEPQFKRVVVRDAEGTHWAVWPCVIDCEWRALRD